MLKNNSLELSFKNIIDKLNIPYKIIIEQVHNLTVPTSWSFTNRIANDFHFALIKSKGEGYYTFEDKNYSLDLGRIIFISSKLPYSRYIDKKQLCKMTIIRFSFIDINSNSPINFESAFGFSFIPKNIHKYSFLSNSVVDSYSNENGINLKLCENYISLILHELFNDYCFNNKLTAIDSRLEKSIAYIQRKVPQPVSTEELAKISGLSANYFRRIFLSKYKLTPKQYTLKLTMEKAQVLLSESTYSIKEVAEIMGYSDQYAFSKQFKKVIGASPSQYTSWRRPVVT